MKHSVLSLLFVTLLLLPLSSMHAQEEGGPPPPRNGGFLENFMQAREGRPLPFGEETRRAPEQFRGNVEDMQERMMERRERFASTSILMKGEFSERVKEMVGKRAEHAASLFDAMVLRLQGLSERIAARIETLKERGVDTSDAEALLAEANEKIDDAETAIQEVKDAMSDALESETPREEMQNVKTLAQTAKEAVKAAHEALVETITALPYAQNGGAQEEPSPTNE